MIARDDSLQGTVHWLPQRRSEAAAELNYSVLQQGKDGLFRPVSTIYNLKTGNKRVLSSGGEVSRLSPDRRWIVFSEIEDPQEYLTKANEDRNYGAFLNRTSGNSAPQSEVQLSDVGSAQWTLDSRQLFSIHLREDLYKFVPAEGLHTQWEISRFDIYGSGFKPKRTMWTLEVISRNHLPEVCLMAVTSSQALFVTTSHTGDTTFPDGTPQYSPRVYRLYSLKLKTGKIQELKTWRGVRGLGALTSEGRSAQMAKY